MASQKAARILKRTLSGGALAGSLALLLWWNTRVPGGLVLLASVTLVLAAGAVELARMGSLRALGLCAPLACAATASAGLAFAARAHWIAAGEIADPARGFDIPEALAGAFGGGYGRPALLVLVLAAGVHALAIALGRLRPLAWLAGAGVLFFVLRDPLLAGSRLLPGTVFAAALLVPALPGVLAAPRARELAAVAGLALWLAPPLPFLFSIFHAYQTAGLVALLVLSKIGDTAGYYGGSTFGKRHPFPGISPGKTEWGCVCSFLAATALAGVLYQAGVLPQSPLGLAGGLLAGASLNLAAQSGDLFESWIKRRAGVKDSSGCFGPSGGLLDQLDSFLFTIPMAAATWPWIFPGR
ncbi:MAG: phosphatidate cytidylyltransferase [Planctomycetes bacterium]|nr:phosphatidate cytidylyltransferase [Planctomycetota bacterium]